METKAQWTHPITNTEGFHLFLNWLDRSDRRLDIAAETLGVSTRTAQRWLKQRRVPRRVAVLLEQLANGPAITGALWRGRATLIRSNWRPYLKTKFRDLA